MSILGKLHLDDVRRYLVATNFSTKMASSRILDSDQWREDTFPIDTSECKIELASKQFFQYGFDNNGNPVFYFLNMLRGSWGKNIKNTVNAVLYRLESALDRFPVSEKVTVVVLLGLPVGGTNDFKVHTNYALVCRLYEVLSTHYPERLKQFLLVSDSSWSTVLATSGLFAYIPDAVIRQKVVILSSVKDLKKYIPTKDLAALAGGLAEKEK